MKFFSTRWFGVLAMGVLSTPAFAFSKGNTGYSGKQGASVTCNLCHMNGATPTVTLTGPTSLEAGATGKYTLTIKGGAGVKGGLNVAVDSATAALQLGEGTQVLNGELTHIAPKDFSGGQVSFDFSLVAPSSAGALKLYAAGNSTNGDGASTLDLCATTTLDVAVTAPPPPPSSTPTETEKASGCSALGDSPMLLSVLAAAGMLRLRRRRG